MTLLIGLVFIILVLVFCILIKLTKTNQQEINPEIQFEFLAQTTLDAFSTEIAKIARKEASQQSLLKWLEELEVKGEIDLNDLSNEAYKRVLALRIKSYEDATEQQKGTLVKIRESLRYIVELNASHGSANYGKEISRLKSQEQIEAQRLDELISRLEQLTNSPSD